MESIAPKTEPAEIAEPRVRGVIADTIDGYAEAHGALAITFDAPRGGSMRAREWLEATAAIEGCSPSESRALCETLLRQIGLPTVTTPLVSALPAPQQLALALAEAAIAVWAHRARKVVVPAPPLPWPARDELRRLALDLFAGVDVVLHAREAWELSHRLPVDALTDDQGRALRTAHGSAIVARVYGSGEPYAAWLAALEALDVTVEGGPIAHVLKPPQGIGVREVIAAAYDAELDLLECREMLG